MTPAQIAALDALIAAVEAGKGGDAVGYYAARVFNPGYAHAINAYHGSLDAARALHDAVLPDCAWFLSSAYRGDEPEAGIDGFCIDVTASNENPARAWLLAILRAIKSQVRHD